jgi:hypothetical protein
MRIVTAFPPKRRRPKKRQPVQVERIVVTAPR